MLSDNEIALFSMLYENDKPEQNLLTAIKVFAAFLEQLEAVPEPQAVCLQESF